MELRLTDNDHGEITVSRDGCELRGWSYKDDAERRQKMLQAREYVEGWHAAMAIDKPHIHVAGTMAGKHIDECAKCGRDLRDPIHARCDAGT